MKKALSVVLALALVFTMVACGASPSGTPADGAAKPEQSAGEAAQSNGEIVLLISAAGTLDDRSFSEACYKGIAKFCDETGMSYTNYQPSEDTAEAQLIVCDTAVKAGAKFIVINSDQFKVSASMMAEKYPEVTFIIFDTVPVTPDGEQVIKDNILAIQFAEQQAAFIAGYAAVKDGHKKVGFMGGQAVPAVVRFGYGFVQGADQAAQDMGLTDVSIMYNYTGDFEATPENQARAASWYQSGTEVIFACGGPMGASVFAAAEQNKGLVIGVDSDQAGESDTIITSAIKDLANVTYNTLMDWKNSKFVGGKVVTYTAAEGGVGLPWASSKFKTFSEADYNTLYERLSKDEGGISSALATDTTFDSPAQIPLKAATLTYVE